jgi:putative endonuclease
MEAAVYILTNAGNNVLYVGATAKRLKQRIWEHKEKLVKSFTAKYDINKLVYYEGCEDAEQAFKRERQLKNWHREWKINLIDKFNPTWKDLYPELE